LKFLADNSSACSTLAPSAPSSTWFLYGSKAIRTNWLRVRRPSYPRAHLVRGKIPTRHFLANEVYLHLSYYWLKS